MFFSIFFMPIWVSVILVITGMIYFNFFLEGIILFFISDLYFGVEISKLYNIIYASTLISVVIFIIIEFLKKRLKFNQ